MNLLVLLSCIFNVSSALMLSPPFPPFAMTGHFAVVKLARHVFTGERVAVKVIEKMKLDTVSRAHLYQEVRCMKLVQHPHVVRLYEVIDTQTKLYLVLELGEAFCGCLLYFTLL